jgi:hypothetical protein
VSAAAPISVSPIVEASTPDEPTVNRTNTGTPA